jgi:hypothetical protein
MSLLSNLFSGKKALPEEEQKGLAASLLQEARALASNKPKKALSLLRRKSKPAYDVLRIGGSLHGEFRSLVVRIRSRQKQCRFLLSSAVEVICWDTWQYPMLRDIADRARKTEAEVLYMTPAPKRSPRDAMAEFEALQMLYDPEVGVMTIGEEGVFLRCSLILATVGNLPDDAEEIIQDMLDQAKVQGLKTGWVTV